MEGLQLHEYVFFAYTAILTAFVGFMFWWLKHWITKRDGEVNERAEARKKESLLLLKMTKAIGKLANANCIATKTGKCNGELTDAQDYYRGVSREMTEFLQKQAIENIN